MPDTILTTKLFVPALRPQLVPRPRLTEKLNTGLQNRLALISAPAGFGKSTLVAEWVNELREESVIKVSYLSLDEADNDPVRFLRYVLAALNWSDGAESNFWQDLIKMIQSSQTPPVELVLNTLINKFVEVDENRLLVLDDYHLIENQSIHEALNYLVENSPPNLHILMATREDPQLPLARMRARGQLTELRAADLRFTTDEVAAFLNQVMGLNLTKEDVAALEGRTEGWIAGLQLAAISLQGQTDTAGLIRSFTGSNRHVMDYLIEDVLSKQPEKIQTFLHHTAILERLNESLCDAVTGQEDGQQVLSYLEQANLFIIPLDNERHWYRYHHLFSDLLRQRLQSTHPELLGKLHARAVLWYEAQGYLLDAIYHAFAGEDIPTAVRLIEKGAEDALERGDFDFIFNAVARLPEAERDRSPWLFIYHVWALVLTGKLDRAARLLEDTDWLVDEVSGEAERKKMKGYLAGVRAFYSSWQWNDQLLMACTEQAFACLPKNHWVLGYCAMSKGTVYWGTGDLKKAVEIFTQADEIGKASGHSRVAVTSTMYLIHSLEQQGRLHQALHLCRDAFTLTQSGGRKLPLSGYLHIEIARSLYQLNELDEAKEHLIEGMKFCRQMGDTRVEKLGLYQLVRIHLAHGDINGATQSLQDAQKAHPGKGPLVDMRGLEYPQVLVWLARNRYEEVETWLRSETIDLASISFFKAKLSYTMHARAMIALGRGYAQDSYLKDAHHLLDELSALVETRGWENKEIEIEVLRALCLQAQGDIKAAIKVLEDALRLAERDGFIRIFVDEGEPMEMLLKIIKPKENRLREYISKLLAAFGTRAAFAQPLVEPLSDREIEVLEKIAEGLTNAEVAARLYLSLNTIKVHTRNIYQKLGTNNRTQAVTRARELGILSSP